MRYWHVIGVRQYFEPMPTKPGPAPSFPKLLQDSALSYFMMYDFEFMLTVTV